MTTPEPQKRTLVVPLEDVEWRNSGDPDRPDETTLRGHAAVFNSLSEDLGGFREKIEPGFFRAALKRKPDVRLLVNHDGLPLARTASGTLELREDARGLHVFARLDRGDADVEQLRRKMQRGDVDQMSFAFTLREDGDEWALEEDGTVIRTLLADGADELFDVSVVTFPAYRATEVSMRSVLQDAISRGRVPVTVEQAERLASDEDEPAVAPSLPLVAGTASNTANFPNVTWEVDTSGFVKVSRAFLGDEEGSTEVAQTEESEGEEADVAPSEGVEQASDLLAELKDGARAARNEARLSYLRLLKENGLA